MKTLGTIEAILFLSTTLELERVMEQVAFIGVATLLVTKFLQT